MTDAPNSLTVLLWQHENHSARLAAPAWDERTRDALVLAHEALAGRPDLQQGLVDTWTHFRELLECAQAHAQARQGLLELARLLNLERVAALSDLDDALNNRDAVLGRQEAYERGYADAMQDAAADAYGQVADDIADATGMGGHTARQVLAALSGAAADEHALDMLIDTLVERLRIAGF
jgi:hypothetical protein